MEKLTVEEKQILKAKGILNQKQEEFYAIRFLSKVGYFKAEEMIALSEIAKEFGNGELSLTSRLTIEIPYIKEKNINHCKIQFFFKYFSLIPNSLNPQAFNTP